MRRSVNRSARSGRFVKARSVRRSPRTTIRQTVPRRGSGTRYRSAITGKYMSKAAAARHPNTSIREV
jgi:hypothetical protein